MTEPTADELLAEKEQQERLLQKAMQAAFDDFLLEHDLQLDYLPVDVRAQMLVQIRVVLEYGFCKGTLYEMMMQRAKRK